MQLQIHPIHFAIDSKLKEYIEKKAEKLAQFNSKIDRVDVFLKLENNDAETKLKVVEFKVHAPGGSFFSTETSNMFEAGVDLCVDSIKKQIIKKKEKQEQ